MKNIHKLNCCSRSLVSKYQKGVTMLEYALLAAFISVLAITAIKTSGNTISNIWTNIQAAL